MSTDTATADAIGDRPEPPFTVAELLDAPLRRGDAAVRLTLPDWYVVVGHCDAPAGEIASDYGGTLDEWHPVDADADIVEVAPLDRLRDCPAHIEGDASIFQAVDDGLVQPRLLPTEWLAPALEEFVEAENRGEWDGLRAYLEVTR